MEDYASSHSVVKALKGSADPPAVGGPLKIDIARRTWESTNIHFPNKDEVLTEWILSSFIKSNKDNGGPSAKGLVLSAQHWLLLSDVLTRPFQRERQNKIWLSSLLSRLSILNIVVIFFKSAIHAELEGIDGLVEPFVRCIRVLWPLSAMQMNLDALATCVTSILEHFAHDATRLSSLTPISLLAVRSFRQSIGNATGKKRAFSVFMEESFLHWIRVVCLETSLRMSFDRESKMFISEVYQSGIDIFFGLDSLKSSEDPLEVILNDPRYSLINMRSSEYQIVPMLYESYLQELRKHRSTIFASGSNHVQEHTIQNRLRDSGIKIFVACYRALQERGNDLDVMRSTLRLVDVLEEANLVGHDLTGEGRILQEVTAAMVAMLKESEGPERSEVMLQILHTLSRINIDLVDPHLADILSNIATAKTSACPSAETLLREVIDFHAKTRTIPSYLSLILRALAEAKLESQYTSVQEAHRDYLLGVLFGLEHLDYISRSIKAFLTAGQVQETVVSILEMLRETWINYAEHHELDQITMDVNVTEDIVQRTSESRPAPTPSMRDRAALIYSLVARVVATILASVPFNLLSEPSFALVKKVISDSWMETILKAARTAFIRPPLDNSWAAHTVSSATLRIKHALVTSAALRNLKLSNSSVATAKYICSFIRSPSTTPELVIELLRTFFDADFQGAGVVERDLIVGALVSYLETNLAKLDRLDSSDDVDRVDRDASLDLLNSMELRGHRGGALIAWHLLLDRWLTVFDEIASQDNLRKISELFMQHATTVVCEVTGHLSLEWVPERARHSALFWELQNLRDAMLSKIEENTQHADWRDFAELFEDVKQSSARIGRSRNAWTKKQIESILPTFTLLLRAPKEYLPRPLWTTLIRRAIIADLAVSSCARDDVDIATRLTGGRKLAVRAWLVSMSEASDMMEVVSGKFGDYFRYLVDSSDEFGENEEKQLDDVTLVLLHSISKQVVHSAVHGEDKQFSSLCALLLESRSRRAEQYRLQLSEMLVSECPSHEKLPNGCIEAIRELYTKMSAQYSDAMAEILASGKVKALTIRAWRNCLLLQRWLSIADTNSDHPIGHKLLRTVTTDKHNTPADETEIKEYCTEAYLLILTELENVPSGMRERHLELILSAYILLRRGQATDQTTCDAALGRTVKSIQADEFAHLLSLIREALTKGLGSIGELQTAVHLSRVLLDEAPEGSMRIIQEHFEECLHIYVDDPLFVTENAELSLEVLCFIEQVGSEKPAYLRQITLGPIWLLLYKLLIGSKTHSPETHAEILHRITLIASSLIRLRRDLVTSTLPHLGMVLSSLVRALRSPRAQLGARQRAQVADTLPWWVSPTAPLGVPEARAVARLLTSLQTKTIPRSFTSRGRKRGEGKTAESLSSAFSKHAAPVLGAYINSMVDPLVSIDLAMRENLAPGLYVLCDSMREHGRDALMVSGCDAAGRMVFKALWKEYEKQRYVGKG